MEKQEKNGDVEKWEERHQEVVPAVTDNSPAALMHAAISGGVDIEKLEKLLLLQNQWEERESRKQYVAAMAAFKINPPEIEKDKKVSFKTSKGETSYYHASLANVTQKINSALGEHGLSASWGTVQAQSGITVTCTIMHRAGYSESTSLTASPDTSGTKNSIQAVGSTISYLERYTILALTGLATHDMDTDGQGAVEYITKKMQAEIEKLIKSTKADKVRVLKYLKAASVETILLSDYGKAIVAFTAKSEQKPEKPMRQPGDET